MTKWLKKLTSRKFLVAIGSAAALALGAPDEIVYTCVAYILGEGLSDAAGAFKR